MPTADFNSAPDHTSDATFRAWGSGLAAALETVGLVQLSSGDSSGQIDWGTVAKPAAINTAQGYEMMRLNDTLQATYPIFIKIEYGSGSNVAYPAIWITIGVAHDGAGNLTGLKTTRQQITGAKNTATTYACHVSGDTNRISVMMWDGAAGTVGGWAFCIERTHDAAGADTNEGFVFVYCYPSSTSTIIVYIMGTGVLTTETMLPALLPSVGTGSSGSAVAVYPIFPTKGTYLNPLSQWLVVWTANITPGTPISFTYYGATRSFLPISNLNLTVVCRGNIYTGVSMLLRND